MAEVAATAAAAAAAVGVFSVSKMKLVALLKNAGSVIPFSSEEECDELFDVVARFAGEAVTTRKRCRDVDFSQASLAELVGEEKKCRSECEPSIANPRNCACCEKTPGDAEENRFSSSCCLDCLCLAANINSKGGF